MKVVVDFDVCESNAVCMGDRARGLRGPRRRLPVRPPGEPARGAPRQGSRRRFAAARSRPSPSRTDVAAPYPGSMRHVVDRRRVPGRAERGRDAARARLRRHDHRRRPRARAAGRPAPAVEAGAGRDDGAGGRAPAARRASSTTSTSTCASASAPPRSRPVDREVDLDDGTTLSVDGVVLATGADAAPPRRPTSPACTCCATSTTAWPSRPTSMPAPRRVVVIGAGFIGAEVAATLSGSRARRHDDRGAVPVPMQRVLPATIGDFVTELHRDHGVDVRLGVGVDGLIEVRRRGSSGSGSTDGTRRRRRRGGGRHRCDPEHGWLEGSGLDARQRRRVRRDVPGRARRRRRRRRRPLAEPALRRDACGSSTGRTRSSRAAYAARRLLGGRRARAEPFAPVPVVLVRPVRPQDPDGRTGRPRRRGGIVDGSIEERRFVAVFRRGDRCVGRAGREPARAA